MTLDSPEEKNKKTVEDIKKESEKQICPVQRALYFIEEFISGPMCSKCYPCSLGTAEVKSRLQKLVGHAEGTTAEDMEILMRIGLMMIEGSFCKKGKDTGKFIADSLSSNADEFTEHLSCVCRSRECMSIAAYTIDPGLCNMCGKCLEVCRERAILGEKKKPYQAGYLPFEIRKKRCTGCGECLKVCPTGAIIAVYLQPEPVED